MGVDKNRFAAIIKEYGGGNISTYLSNLRLEYSVGLLLSNENMSVKEIAFRSAFPNSATYYRLFKEKYGISPVAMDFDYVLPDGKKNSLLRTGVKGDRLLLVFYDPECPSCHDVMNQMIMDEALRNAVADGKVTVLAVYTEGDVDVWKKSLSDMPEGWIVVHDNMVVKEKALYDLKAMPSIYLLDGEKKVILKDAMYGEVRSVIFK